MPDLTYQRNLASQVGLFLFICCSALYAGSDTKTRRVIGLSNETANNETARLERFRMALRAAQGNIGQRKFARMLGLSQQTLSGLYTGYSKPGVKVLQALLKNPRTAAVAKIFLFGDSETSV